MAKAKVKIRSAGIRELLNDDGVRSFLTDRAGPVLAAAQASAPVATGAYKAGLQIRQATTDRAVVRVVASAHGAIVEARTGNLARALDSA